MKRLYTPLKYKKWVFTGFTILLTGHLFSQPIYPDNSFGTGGMVVTTDSRTTDIVTCIVQPDEKIVAVGYTLSLGEYHARVVRYHADGSLDNGFGSGGITDTEIGNWNMPYCAALQPDGKILVGGMFREDVIRYHSSLIRYNPDGSLDQGFGQGGVLKIYVSSMDDGIASLFVQPDGKIVTGGWVGNSSVLMRFNPDGVLDPSFGNAGRVFTTMDEYTYIYAIKRQVDGKIVTSGTTGAFTDSKFALARYHINGNLDSTFGINGKVMTDFHPSGEDVASMLEIQPDGKIIAAGYSVVNLAMARYNPDGTLDNGFASGGQFTGANYPSATGIVLQPDGKFILSGSKEANPYDYGWNIMRFNTDGFIDTNFGIQGHLLVNIKPGHDYATCIVLQPDHKILVGGSSRDSASVPASMTLLRFTSESLTTEQVKKDTGFTQVYPNPFYDDITIRIKKSVHPGAVFQLYDNAGKQVFVYDGLEETSLIRLNHLPNGIYFYKILENSLTVAAGKLVKS